MDNWLYQNAWTNEEEKDVATCLKELGISKIEIAPTKIWKDPVSISNEDISEYLKFWEDYGIEVVAFQSMLYGHPEMKLFADDETRKETQDFLEKFIILAGKMKASKMVFGSPKNRQKETMPAQEAENIAVTFFDELGSIAPKNHTYFCLEPNPAEYDCDYITNVSQGQMVRKVNNPGFGLHLDTGNDLAGDPIKQSREQAAPLLQHFHASSPYLALVEKGDIDHEQAAKALKDIGYAGFISIEMRPDEKGRNVERVKQAVNYIKTAYELYLT